MSWAKLDDGFWMHPKIAGAGNELAGMFARCLSYCGCYLTDGRVPKGVALSIAGDQALLNAAVQQGLLQELPSGDLYVRDWADYNPLRAEVEAEQERRKDRAKNAANKRWGNQSRA